MDGDHRRPDDKRTDTEYLADVLAEAIRDGFRDLGDRISQGKNPENVAMSLKLVAGSLDGMCTEIAGKD